MSGVGKKKTHREWTTKEQRQLSMMYGIEPVAVICQRLGRTRSSVHNRAQVLGLDAQSGRQARKIHCRETIKRMILAGKAASEIAKEIGTTSRMIRWIANRDLPGLVIAQLYENGKRSQSQNSNNWRKA